MTRACRLHGVLSRYNPNGSMARRFVPAQFQPPFPAERFLLHEAPGDDALDMDVVVIGAGPAGLSAAIELARQARARPEIAGLQIAVLDKAAALGEHNLSGAVLNPRALRDLFPDVRLDEVPFVHAPVTRERVYFLTQERALRLPTPPTMRNHGNVVISICELVRWLGERAEELEINLLPGFPVGALLVDGDRVVGVRTVPSGLGRDGQPGPRYEPPTDLRARVVVVADGTRSPFAEALLQWQNVGRTNPPIYALGVKEVWETRHPLDAVVHTLGWPVPSDAFGGSFLYPMSRNRVALGLVVGLDYRAATLDVHELLQRFKTHPRVRHLLDGGELLEWGAKTIPEGGFYSLPDRLTGPGYVLVGDAAGFVDVPSLKGIHYAMQSGIYAARAIADALAAGEPTAARLAAYDRQVAASYIRRDLYRTRNMRLAFHAGLVRGAVRAGLMTLTSGRWPAGPLRVPADAEVPRQTDGIEPFVPDGKLTFSKLDAVYRSGNKTRDDIPIHLVVGRDVPAEVADFYARMCPAGVYERQGDRLVINAPNCVDCKATDVLGPRWTPREGGSGPAYKQM